MQEAYNTSYYNNKTHWSSKLLNYLIVIKYISQNTSISLFYSWYFTDLHWTCEV